MTNTKNKTMNELIHEDLKKADKSKVYITDPKSSIILPEPPQIITSKEIKMTEPRDIPEVKAVLEYNRNVMENLEPDYSGHHLKLINGGIIVRLFKRIPIYKGIFRGFTVPVVGSKQLKPEFAKDPYFFNNIGVVVNFDWTYTRDEHLMFEVGSIVQVNALEAITIVKKLEGAAPFLQNEFRVYNEERPMQELGYIKITKRELDSVIENFKMEEYERNSFGES